MLYQFHDKIKIKIPTNTTENQDDKDVTKCYIKSTRVKLDFSTPTPLIFLIFLFNLFLLRLYSNNEILLVFIRKIGGAEALSPILSPYPTLSKTFHRKS